MSLGLHYKRQLPLLCLSLSLVVARMGIVIRIVQVAAVLFQCMCCRVPQSRAHQETEEPHNDYRLLPQGPLVLVLSETKVHYVI